MLPKMVDSNRKIGNIVLEDLCKLVRPTVF